MLRAIRSEITDHLVNAGFNAGTSNVNLNDLNVPESVEVAENWVLRVLKRIADRHTADEQPKESRAVIRISPTAGRRRRDENLNVEGCEEIDDEDLEAATTDGQMTVILANVQDHEVRYFICPCTMNLPDDTDDVEYIAHEVCIEGELAATDNNGGGDDGGGGGGGGSSDTSSETTGGGLDGGAIAGIVVGSLAGV